MVFIGTHEKPLIFAGFSGTLFFDEKVTELGQSEKSIFLPKDGATASNWTDRTLYGIRLGSISTLTILF